MAPITQPYRNQHVELARLAAGVPLNAADVNAREASLALQCLKSVLIVHLKMQDGMLYPWMKRQNSSELRAKGARFHEMMRTLMVAFVEFYQRWSSRDAIEADPDGFVAAWRLVWGVLKHRLEAESSDLYRAIDAYGARSSETALAS